MVTYSKVSKTCSCCRKSSNQLEIVSYSTFGGSMDLDFRPPPMARDTIRAWIENCPDCGYCSKNIGDAEGKSREAIVESEAYKQQLNSTKFPKSANHFLCYSMILEREGGFVEAVWQAIRGSWICDDERADEGAKQCRLRAAQLIEQCRTTGVQFNDKRGIDLCLEADLLRRAADFERAKSILESAEGDYDETVEKVFAFEKQLIDLADTSCHTVAEAIQYK